MNKEPFFYERTAFLDRLQALEKMIGIAELNDYISLIERLTAIEEIVSVINTDPTTRTYIDNKLLTKINKTGDTLLGNLELLVTPVNANHLINKGYVDNADALKVNKTGNTLTGYLVLHANPISTMQPTTKQYVDAIDIFLQSEITNIQSIVTVLNTDPVTKTYVDSHDTVKVNKAGDTLTGFLTLHADPISNMQPTTKQYVDILKNIVNNLNLDPVNKTYTDVQNSLKVSKTGDTMTGFLTLNADPISNMQPATKQYVDTADNVIGNSISNMQGILTTLNNDPVTKTYVDSHDTVKVNKAGDTLTGFLTLHADPTAALHPTSKQYVDVIDAALQAAITILQSDIINLNTDSVTKTYVDNQDNTKINKDGDTLSGILTVTSIGKIILNNNISDIKEAVNKEYVDAADIIIQGSVDAIQGTLTSLSIDSVTKTYVDTKDSLNVLKTGDTLTGFLTLHTDPTSALHSATKQYVDDADNILQSAIINLNTDSVTKTYVDTQDNTKINKDGDTMTGFLLLSAEPTADSHAATKKYVDAVSSGLITKPSARLATTIDVNAIYNNGTLGVGATLTGNVNGALTVDGILTIINDRIIIKNQINSLENGLYIVNQVGDTGTPFILIRESSTDQSSEVAGSFFLVTNGDTLSNTGWVISVNNVITFTIGTDTILFNQFSGQNVTIAGNGLTSIGNTIDINSASASRIVVNTNNIDLATTGVVPGDYAKMTVDAYGRITNTLSLIEADIPNLNWNKITTGKPTTLFGYSITDGQPLNVNLTNLSNVNTFGLVVRDSGGNINTTAISTTGNGISLTNGSGISAGNIFINSSATSNNIINSIVYRDSSGNFSANNITANLVGNSNTATKLQTSRTITLTGDVVSTSGAFDGSSNISLNSTLSNTGVIAGSYTKVTTDVKGRILTGGILTVADIPNLDFSKITTGLPTTLSGYGISDYYTFGGSDVAIINGSTVNNRGGLLVLGYKNRVGLIDESTETWCLKVDSNNNLNSCTTDSLGNIINAFNISRLDGTITFASIKIQGTVSIPGAFDVGITIPIATNRLNYNGTLYATNFNGNGSNISGINASNILTGTLSSSIMPSFIGEVTSTVGSNLLSLSTTGVIAGTYTKVIVDTKGRVIDGSTLISSDIPNLDFSKITTGLPTTLAGYGITDGLTTGCIIGNIINVPMPGYLKCNGAYIDKITYSNLFAVIGNKYDIHDDLGDGKPWKNQYSINDYQFMDLVNWGHDTLFPIAISETQSIVTKNRVYTLGGWNGTTAISDVYTAIINTDGTLGAWVLSAPLPGSIYETQAIVTKNRVYLIGGNDGINYVSTVYTAPINSDGTLGVWSVSSPIPVALGDSQVVIIKNKVYLIGGNNLTGTLSTIYIAPINIDGTIGAWILSTPLPTTIGYSQASVIGNYIYLFAGKMTGIKTLNIYKALINADGTLGVWTLSGNLPIKSQSHEIYVTHYKVYILAMDSSNNNNTPSNKVYTCTIEPDGTLGAWTTGVATGLNDLNTVLNKTSLITTGSRIYLIGGVTPTISNSVISAPLIGSYSDYTNLTLLNSPDITKFRLPDLYKREIEDKIFYHIKA